MAGSKTKKVLASQRGTRESREAKKKYADPLLPCHLTLSFLVTSHPTASAPEPLSPTVPIR